MKLSELHESIRAVKFFPLMVTDTDACERLGGQAAVIASSLSIVASVGLNNAAEFLSFRFD